MYGQHQRPRGARGMAQPQPANQFFHQNPNAYIQNPSFNMQSPGFSNPNVLYAQNPNFPTSYNSYLQNPSFPQLQQFSGTYGVPQNPNETLQRIDQAVVKVRGDLLSSEESITSWKVLESTLLLLCADSLSSLGFQMQQVPSLHRLMVIEGKVNSFIHCFVGVRRITSLHDLDVAICKNESVGRFEDLELGPLLRHPLVVHYFSVPSDVKEVVRITSEEIVSYLAEYISSCASKDVDVEGFLDFVTKKRFVAVKEKLGIRIQSLRIHVTYIQDAINAEDSTLKSYIQGTSNTGTKKLEEESQLQAKRKGGAPISVQKKLLDRRFKSISQRVESFPPINSDLGGKHIKFTSSSSEDEEDYSGDDCMDHNDLNRQRQVSSQNRSCDRVSTCPYPSVNEEMTRLGLNIETGGHPSPSSGHIRCDDRKAPSRRKRKYKNQNADSPFCRKLTKRDKRQLNMLEENSSAHSQNAKRQSPDDSVDEINDLELPTNEVEKFITTWKETCRVHPVAEVFERMFLFYDTKDPKKKRVFPNPFRHRKKMFSLFSMFPCIGLLNIAVTSIKLGMWDSLYDAFQLAGEHRIMSPTSSPTELETIDVELLSKNDASQQSPSYELNVPGITLDDVIKNIATYFELDVAIVAEDRSPFEKQLICWRKLRHCEIWLAKKFSVKDFDSLGYGEFFKFLEDRPSLLANKLFENLSLDSNKKSFLEVSIPHYQLLLILSQAARNMWQNDTITNQDIAVLLKKQFPLIGFEVSVKDPLGNLSEILPQENRKKGDISSCVLFSATLCGSSTVRGTLAQSQNNHSEATGVKEVIDLGPGPGPLGPVSSKDAVKCLLEAPMLSNLQLWSHWDLIFAPSLGPLLEFLINEVRTKDLMVLLTKDGEIIRIDPSVTVDEFLEASLKGSSFQTAVKILSLICIYGGERHTPSSLLKCHAHRAIEVILKNSSETHDECKVQFRTKETISLASRFILECLSYLPPEFRCFAADVFLSGLQSFTKDGPSAILRECSQINHRRMLHYIGLSLGIGEWISDYRSFSSSDADASSPAFSLNSKSKVETSENFLLSGAEASRVKACNEVQEEKEKDLNDKSKENCSRGSKRAFPVQRKDEDAALIIELIRQEEFGLVPSLTQAVSSILEKQHARIGRIVNALSKELYSQDSHFLLELVQNADDNVYLENVEPTIVFILQSTGVIILNNEQGFSARNIRALCDVGNSTKKGSSAGYIGRKGIGFKSVFRVTDSPEIHSNGFHVKFDISEDQIGFVLPTVVPPCDIDLFRTLVASERYLTDETSWNTCIVLPFKSELREEMGINSIVSMFSDLHPSILLFLHRLQCIKFKNMLSDSLLVMRKETVGDGIVKISNGKEKMSWFVATQKLNASVIRPDVEFTEIAIALTLQEFPDGIYKECLDQQPVFAFLPLRTYGLKFILQGDFVVPSSREEVDRDSAWNQWLLSEFPGLFVSALRSFCALRCFQETRGKAVATYMSFVPLVGEVHGFFSHLPRMIISKLRTSNCLLLEGRDEVWVPPCKVLRGWSEQSRVFLPETLLQKHLGLGYLDKNIIMSNPLANSLGVQDYGPKVLIDLISSICQTKDGIKLLGISWLSSWLNALDMMWVHSFTQNSEIESGFIKILRKIPFVPLSDGTFSSIDESIIWLPCDVCDSEGDHGPEAFPILYAKLRTVSPALLSSTTSNSYSIEKVQIENLTVMLQRVGVQRLTAHEIMRVHILPAISDDRITNRDNNLMIEYLSFVMLHLQSSCTSCSGERDYMFEELKNKAFILTNYGYKRPIEVSIHFSREFGNPVDVRKLMDVEAAKWHEVDNLYLMHPSTKSLPLGLKWREFLQKLEITDFVKLNQIEKNIADGDLIKDWDSPELAALLSTLSSCDQERCKYLLEALDILWDDYYGPKVMSSCISKSKIDCLTFKSMFMKSIQNLQWVPSSVDQMLHFPKDLFYDCETVRSILGSFASYAVPQVRSRKFLNDIGFKTEVTLLNALENLHVWRRNKTDFKASVAQMSKYFALIWDGISTSKAKILEELSSGPSIFVPFVNVTRHEDVTSGILLPPNEVYWNDPTGTVERTKELFLKCGSCDETSFPISKALAHVYPGFHTFFVNVCGVSEIPPFQSYLHILVKLSNIALPSQAANTVLQILLKWADDLRSGLMSPEDALYLKDCLLKLKYAVLPTVHDKWVSLHPDFGIVCWCDDEKLRKQFKHSDNISFVHFGELSDHEKKVLSSKVYPLMQTIGVPFLSEVISREAIFYATENSRDKSALVNWALPYAQRYLYNQHLDKYLQMKESEFENLSQLQVVVVDKLFYKNTLKGIDSASKKRFECSCVLQENNLYMTRASDYPSIFSELSGLFLKESPKLQHLANFLLLITTMAESGSTMEEIEFFIVNNQKFPKLPDEEITWSLHSFSLLQVDEGISHSNNASTTTDDNILSKKSKRKPGINSNWPPADWKTAPDFSFARANRSRTVPGCPSQPVDMFEVKPEYTISYTVDRKEICDWVIEEDDLRENRASIVLQDSRTIEKEPVSVRTSLPAKERGKLSLEVLNKLGAAVTDPANREVNQNVERDRLSFGTPNKNQMAITGRTGELVAFKYFMDKVGEANVWWVNQETETGLPYDLVIGETEESRQYIEVKATKSGNKDWFNITVREWEFAMERRESYSIAHVVLMGSKNAKVTVFRNPYNLSQHNVLQLAMLMSNRPKELYIVD